MKSLFDITKIGHWEEDIYCIVNSNRKKETNH